MGVSKDSVAILLRTGRLKGFKVGRSWRVSPESVRAYEAENVNKNPAPPPVSKRRIVTRIY